MIPRLREKKLHVLIVSSPANVRYLSGFTGSNGVLLLAEDAAVLYTDPRYEIQAAQESDCKVRVVRGAGGLLPALMQTVKRKRWKHIGFEKAHLKYGDYEALKEHLRLGASLEPASGIVEQERMVKSDEEIQRIRRSVETNSKAFDGAVNRVRAGMTERDLAAELEYQMRRLGAEHAAFETIVAAGERSALPHARPGNHAIAANQMLLIDMGATQDGYTSDMTRMLFVGTPPPRAQRLYDAVLEAQLAAIGAVRDGIVASSVDRSARQALRSRGLDKAFVHSTGHGLGLEIHEPPRLGKRDKTRLRAGMVVTIEPGAYLEGFGGVRIEDTVLVTGEGCEVLTPTPKELLAIE